MKVSTDMYQRSKRRKLHYRKEYGYILVIMFVITSILNETLTMIRNFEVNIVYYISYNKEYD